MHASVFVFALKFKYFLNVLFLMYLYAHVKQFELPCFCLNGAN